MKSNLTRQLVSNDARTLFKATAVELTHGNKKLSDSMERWLNERFSQGRWHSKEHDRAFDYLRVFADYRSMLGAVQRDLFRYRDLPDLHETVKSVLKNSLPPLPYRPGDMVWLNDPAEDGGMLLGMPRTIAAARKYGYRSKWCVAAREDEDNEFEDFAVQAPLLYILSPDSTKYCWAGHEGQFRNATNHTISNYRASRLLKINPHLPEQLTAWGQIISAFKGKLDLVEFPEVWRTEALEKLEKDYGKLPQNSYVARADLAKEHLRNKKYYAAVSQVGFTLKDIPLAKRTAAVCRAAVKQNGLAVAYVPKALLTPELCFAAVSNNGWALKHVPGKFCTDELRLAAVRQNGAAIMHVPSEYQSLELCIAALQPPGSEHVSLDPLQLCIAADLLKYDLEAAYTSFDFEQTLRSEGHYFGVGKFPPLSVASLKSRFVSDGAKRAILRTAMKPGMLTK